MHIIQLASELAPVAKVGGLGDVVFGLSQELSKNGNDVEIIIPKYDCLDFRELKNLKVEKRELWSFEGPYRYNNTIWSAEVDRLKIILIEPHHPKHYFSRGKIYDCPDDIDRFAYFTRTALEYLFKRATPYDVLHCHDWPTGLAPVLYKEMYQKMGLALKKTILTIHNLQHQGKCTPANLSRVGLRGEDFLTPDKLQDPYSPGLLNLLKGGIVYADSLTTVSPNYEKEIQTIDGGCGLDQVLVKYKHKLKGILNGLDETYWNPATDPHLIAQYTKSTVQKGKAENRKHILTHFGLAEKNAPIVASVGRLVSQKSPQLILYALQRTLEKGGQFLLLGSTTDPALEKAFKAFSENENTAINLDHDESMAHLFFAAADMFIIPSLFEPCGLTQMIAMRYGAVPIARKTGGLADTVFDWDTSDRPQGERNGFTFDFPDTQGVDWALDRALKLWKEEPKAWKKIQAQGMSVDFSWAHSTPEYLKIYQT